MFRRNVTIDVKGPGGGGEDKGEGKDDDGGGGGGKVRRAAREPPRRRLTCAGGTASASSYSNSLPRRPRPPARPRASAGPARPPRRAVRHRARRPAPPVPQRTVAVDIWDTAGQERFNKMHPAYYHRAHACILVFDVTRKNTYQHLSDWCDPAEPVARRARRRRCGPSHVGRGGPGAVPRASAAARCGVPYDDDDVHVVTPSRR